MRLALRILRPHSLTLTLTLSLSHCLTVSLISLISLISFSSLSPLSLSLLSVSRLSVSLLSLLSQEDPGKEPHIKDFSPLPPKRAPCFFLPRCPPLSHSGALAFAPPLASSPLHPTHSMRIILAKMQIFTMAAAETKSGHDGRTADLDQLEDDNSFPKCVECLARSMFCVFKFSNVFFIFVTLFHLAWFLGRLGSSSQTLKLQAFYHWIIHACQTKLHNPEAQNPTSHIDRSRRLRIL